MTVQIDIQIACSEPVPPTPDLKHWLGAALAEAGAAADAEISLRLIGELEMVRLNREYRDRHGATNVLSFPAALPEELGLPLLGDIVICAPVVQREAQEQSKAPDAHWAHMAVHGCLHLLGFDHVQVDDAIEMEALETRILFNLGYPCPYDSDPLLERTAP
jgi:probable rRNA maturation factor